MDPQWLVRLDQTLSSYSILATLLLLVLVAGSASYFTDTFGTIIDRDMIQNAAVTTSGEARNLLTTALG